jgi:hypothetical protein
MGVESWLDIILSEMCMGLVLLMIGRPCLWTTFDSMQSFKISMGTNTSALL